MTDSVRDRRGLAFDGYRPLTEGYQPGAQIKNKGLSLPVAGKQPPPPRGGSSASRPASPAVQPKKS